MDSDAEDSDDQSSRIVTMATEFAKLEVRIES